MASRSYRRRANGQFAARGDAGTKVTVGKAGGFANAALRARVGSKAGGGRRTSVQPPTGGGPRVRKVAGGTRKTQVTRPASSAAARKKKFLTRKRKAQLTKLAIRAGTTAVAARVAYKIADDRPVNIPIKIKRVSGLKAVGAGPVRARVGASGGYRITTAKRTRRK